MAAADSAGTPKVHGKANGRPGSDFMVDVIRSLDIKYLITNPASSLRGIHESLNNYGRNKDPELLTCMHEESGTAMAHGYFKVAGKPLGLLFHGTVGLQHASMAIYNAWCDRVPMLVMVGNHLDAANRPPNVPTLHSAQDPIAMVRDFTKWDDQPTSLQHFAESMVRAYRIAMTPPLEPVCISLDAHLQEHATNGETLSIPKLRQTAPPQGDAAAVKEAAKMLVEAQNPVIVVDRAARTARGMALIVELAETLQAAVVDQLGRMNIPNRHHCSQPPSVIGRADCVLGLELTDYWGTVNQYIDAQEAIQTSRVRAGTKLISIGMGDLYIRANYQDFQRFQEVDIGIGADAEATLPALIEAVKSAMSPERRAGNDRRAEALRKAKAEQRERARAAAAVAWDASPISTARLSAELWAAIRNEDWALVSRDAQVSNWPHRLWSFEKYHQFIGGPGGAGVGYGSPAAVGAALAHRDHGGRLPVNIQNDGDMMYAPGVLWTAVHHKIPLLTVMHNNRAYHQEVMHVQRLSNWRRRGITHDSVSIATTIDNPNIDYARLAQSMGMQGIGAIEDPKDLGPALKRAVEIVKRGEPVLVDVVTQPR
jgi:thiamine pyrophosphate-dependent acetolactate synthase large subunit-like protein